MRINEARANETRAKPARFDRAQQHRRSMLAKINIARQQLDLVEDDYRQMLFDATGRTSLKDCNDGQLARMIDVLKSKGFRPIPKGGKAPAQHPMARKARALWISLWHLGVVHNASEHALEAFAKEQLGCDRLAWARQSDGNKLIEALKAMGKRKGWIVDDPATGRRLGPIEQKANLCEAILKRLKDFGIARGDWALHDAAWRLCGIANLRNRAWTDADYDHLAGALGKHLRDVLPQGDAS